MKKRLLIISLILMILALPGFAADTKAAEDPASDEQTPVRSLTVYGNSASIKVPANTDLALSVGALSADTLHLAWEKQDVVSFACDIKEGRNDLTIAVWNEKLELESGVNRMRLWLEDEKGDVTAEKYIAVNVIYQPIPAEELPDVWSVSADAFSTGRLKLEPDLSYDEAHLSVATRYKKADEDSYWTMVMGELKDEKHIWDLMMSEITVLDDGKHTGKQTYLLRKTPDESTERANVAGEVTYKSQGVHVISEENGWALVEVYNTSYGDAYKKAGKRQGYGNTAELISGYVQTDVLKRVTPRDDYALLIDKMTQKMHIFEKGKIIGTLLVSTGLNNSQQSWNETPAGEFLIISRTGGFWAGNLYCDMGLLLNNGCLIHEVPSVVYDSGLHDFSSTEAQLGRKASHGCIRVQRQQNAEGQNMRWLWNHLKTNTRVFIWDDTTRYTEYPEDSTQLYYNTSGGLRYHTDKNCSSVNKRYLPLAPFTYGELATSRYGTLKPCKTCGAPARPETIEASNLKNGFNE